MKSRIIFSLFLILSISVFAQPMMKHQRGPKERLEELEKIKLLETLQLSEEIAGRFLVRQKEFRDSQREIMDQRDAVLIEMETALQKGKNVDEYNYGKAVNNLSEMENSLCTHREEFIKSLSDILTVEQIAKLIVFESKFKQELREALRMRRKGQ
ncbi:MAG: hypothetical protein C4543_10380 [Ignavibacteriales bacterium]|jgi:hypothetical protein|nr:hypothetical protein [Melioribacteraceae bacterium]RJP57035.1 MAG: hypothetical protein C4543_10380 [Ignavibacteriales bacterium]